MRPKDTYPLMDELNSAKKLSIDQFWDVLMKFGFKKGSKSRNETKELFLDIKPIEGHLFARKEQALKAVDIIDILKRKKLFHPSLQVFIVEESGIYQLAFIQKALLNGADDQFHSLNHKDPITNNLNTLEVGQLLTSIFTKYQDGQYNHLARWYRRIGELEASNPDIAFMRMINPVELSYTQNWGRDPKTGVLYPIDMECIEFSDEKIAEWEENHR